MKIAIIGIGGVGGYYGGKLARSCAAGNDPQIVFVARGENLRAIQAHGLRLTTEDESFTSRPRVATDDPAGLGIFDVILFCVKSYDLESSAHTLKGNVDERTTIITLLNGVDNAERLKAILPEARICNGCVYIGARLSAPGEVYQAGGSCKLFFGPENGTNGDFEAVETLLRKADIKAECRQDIDAVVWEKFLFVSPFASATAYFDKTFGELMDDEESKADLIGLYDELECVARARNVRLPPDIRELSLGKAASFPHGAKSSMHMDFGKGGRTELETMTGAVVGMARQYGIPAPLHEQVYRALSARAERFVQKSEPA
ncbi:ketopantoate reductase family protein [Methylocaldum gracile]|jgi:2-dehydropantoate 2-reductase|uniref:ketopantoate reductase family protein n=1 Tax=Methylocaldum sp. 0917 TaxID=2485163 RepID=UPI0010D4C3A1